MSAIDKFKKKFGEDVLEDLLDGLINSEKYNYNECSDDLCDDEGCIMYKSFVQFLKYR